MLISEVRESQGQPPAPTYQWGRKRHPIPARFMAALGIMRHALQHPLTAGVINLDTGEVKPIQNRI